MHFLISLGIPFTEAMALESNFSVGNLAPGFSATTPAIRLRHHGKDITYNIFFVARNGGWTQILRMRWVGDGWATANKVLKGSQQLFREVSANFPRTEDGKIDWQDKSAEQTEPPE
jgi:hypothetical protein